MPNSHSAYGAQDRIVNALAALVALWAGVVIVARLSGGRFMSALGRDYVAMSPLAAALMLPLGLALLLRGRKSWPGSGTALALSCLVGLASLWSLAEYALGARQPGPTVPWVYWSSRMLRLSSFTAASVLGLALACACLAAARDQSWRRRQAGALVTLLPLGICAVVLVSYAAGAPLLYGGNNTPMTLPAALMGFCLSLAGLGAAGLDTWPLALFGARATRTRTPRVRRLRRGPAVVFLVLATAILVGGTVVLRDQLRTAQLIVQDGLAAIAELKAGQIADWYAMRQGAVEQISRLALIQGQFHRLLSGEGNAQTEAELKDWMERFRIGEGFARAVLFDAKGQPRLVLPADQALRPAEEFQAQVQSALRLKKVEAQGLQPRNGTTNPILSLWMPLGVHLGPGAPAEGVLLFQLDARPFLYRIVQPWPHAQSSAELMVVGRDRGDAVVLSALRHPPAAGPGMRFSMADHPGMPAVLAAQGREGAVSGPDYRNVPVLASLKRVPGTPWALVVKMDEAEADRPMLQRIWSTGLLLLGLVALVALATGLVVRHQDASRILGQLAAERERKVLAARSEHLMRHANDIILLTDLDGRILEANVAASEHYGYSPEEFRSLHLWDLRRPEQAAQMIRRIETTKAAGSARFESTHLRKDGTEFPVDVSSRVIELGDQSIMLHVARDITGHKQAEEERRRLEARLHQSQKLESLGSLAGGVAHDMNNVLGAILSLATARREGLDPADPMASALETIANACLRGRGVVRSLLYFARKDLDEPRPLDLNELVRDMVHLLGFTTLKRIHLEMDLQEPLEPVLGDAGALSHALMNLAVNALDAMPEQGTLTVRTCSLPGDRVQVSLRDTGTGMTPDVLARATEPFFTTKPAGKGTGLGLAMVFGTVQAHGGELDIRSTPGQGTEVILTFPAHGPAQAWCAPAPAGDAKGTETPLRILVVDDDELIRESLVPMLEVLGHQAQAAPGGAEALAMLDEGLDPDLVILDMNMPGLNGAETLARIKAMRPAQPVLMASGYSDSDIVTMAGGHSGVFYIQKPFTMKELKLKLGSMALV
jgi:PAS domain S-box-containing protein